MPARAVCLLAISARLSLPRKFPARRCEQAQQGAEDGPAQREEDLRFQGLIQVNSPNIQPKSAPVTAPAAAVGPSEPRFSRLRDDDLPCRSPRPATSEMWLLHRAGTVDERG